MIASPDPLALAWRDAELNLERARQKLREVTDEHEAARQAYERAWKAYKNSMESEVGA